MIPSILCLALSISLPGLQADSQAPAEESAAPKWVEFAGGEGPGAGKHIVLISGDEEYRSEEGLPMLARILAVRHGFECTLLFSQDPETGLIDPENQTYIPGIERLREADMLVLLTRFREPPDEWMQIFREYVESGRPILGLRTATHAFDFRRNRESAHADYGWNSSRWPGGFGKQILGETWVAHHGNHGSESTRGLLEAGQQGHPILRGVQDIWGPTDVYRVGQLPADATVLVRGQVLAGMQPSSVPVEGPKNEPLMPIIWTRSFEQPKGHAMRTICSTIGASQDLESEGLRRCLVNACYWGMGLEARISEASDVRLVGPYAPTSFGFGKYTHGVRPADHAWTTSGEQQQGGAPR